MSKEHSAQIGWGAALLLLEIGFLIGLAAFFAFSPHHGMRRAEIGFAHHHAPPLPPLRPSVPYKPAGPFFDRA